MLDGEWRQRVSNCQQRKQWRDQLWRWWRRWCCRIYRDERDAGQWRVLAYAGGTLSRYAAAAMADDALPKPEPKEIDEKLALQLKHLSEDAVLKGVPYGDEKCGNCLYYLNPDETISYCWHPKLRILVGTEWWCQWWEKLED